MFPDMHAAAAHRYRERCCHSNEESGTDGEVSYANTIHSNN